MTKDKLTLRDVYVRVIARRAQGLTAKANEIQTAEIEARYKGTREQAFAEAKQLEILRNKILAGVPAQLQPLVAERIKAERRRPNA